MINNFGLLAAKFSFLTQGVWYKNPVIWLLGVFVAVLLIVAVCLIIKNIKVVINFAVDGGSLVESMKIRKGEYFAMPVPPTKEGYAFGGWFADEKCTLRFVDTMLKRRKKMTIYVRWIEVDNQVRLTKYFDNLRAEMLCYSKAGAFADLGLNSKETLAKMYIRDSYVELFMAFEADSDVGISLIKDDNEQYSETPLKINVKNSDDLKKAQEYIEKLMLIKGFAKVKQPSEIELSEDDRANGFNFVVEYKQVAQGLQDYFLLIREFARSFVLYDIKEGLPNNIMLLRMYLKKDAVYLFLATDADGNKLTKAPFEDTPSLLKVDSANEVRLAIAHIEKIMDNYGLIKENVVAVAAENEELKEGFGYGYRISY